MATCCSSCCAANSAAFLAAAVSSAFSRAAWLSTSKSADSICDCRRCSSSACLFLASCRASGVEKRGSDEVSARSIAFQLPSFLHLCVTQMLEKDTLAQHKQTQQSMLVLTSISLANLARSAASVASICSLRLPVAFFWAAAACAYRSK